MNGIIRFLTGKLNICSLLLAVIFTIVNHYAIYFPWMLHEQDIIVSSTAYKKYKNEHNDASKTLFKQGIARDFLLIDISNDPDTLCDSDKASKLGLATDQGSVAHSPCYSIPNVKKLTLLFKWLYQNRNKYNLVVCDVIFDKMQWTKDNDTLLRYIQEIVKDTGADKIIFSSIYDLNNERFDSASFSGVLPDYAKGAVNEELTDNLFFKYKLSYRKGAIKSLPLLMLEKIDSITVSQGYLGFNKYHKPGTSGIIAANDFIPEMYFTNEDIDLLKTPDNFSPGGATDTAIGKIELWQALLKFNDTENYYLEKILNTTGPRKRNIFIGSFNHSNTDVHKTLYGDMDGGTILLNIYYNLVLQANQVTLGYNLFVWAWFYLIFLIILIHPENIYKGKFLALRVFFNLIIEESHHLLLLLMTILSSLWFNKATNIIVMAFFLLVLSKSVSVYKHNIKKRIQPTPA